MTALRRPLSALLIGALLMGSLVKCDDWQKPSHMYVVTR